MKEAVAPKKYLNLAPRHAILRTTRVQSGNGQRSARTTPLGFVTNLGNEVILEAGE